jgi:ribulose-phosphate 3-epimerase
MNVIPVLNCSTKRDAEERLGVLGAFLGKSELVHVDVADGIFTFHKTWNHPEEWSALRSPFPLEVHLMVEHPEDQIAPWLAAGAKRFVIPVEVIDQDSFRMIAEQCKTARAELMLSSNPETPPEDLTPYLHEVSRFQVLCVNPGLAGQKFLPLVLEKAKWLKYALPNAIIEIDGGITPETAKLAKDAGVNIIVSASYIFGSKDPKGAYEELKKI